MKKSAKREKIIWARDLFKLPDEATLSSIRQTFRRLSKKYHPDTRRDEDPDQMSPAMHELTEAYNILVEYCEHYTIPLKIEQETPLDDEDWWMDRFGRDPLWGKGGD